jgi:hypothetical protein
MDGGIAQFLPVEFRCGYVLAENDSGIFRTVGGEV